MIAPEPISLTRESWSKFMIKSVIHVSDYLIRDDHALPRPGLPLGDEGQRQDVRSSRACAFQRLGARPDGSTRRDDVVDEKDVAPRYAPRLARRHGECTAHVLAALQPRQSDLALGRPCAHQSQRLDRGAPAAGNLAAEDCRLIETAREQSPA